MSSKYTPPHKRGLGTSSRRTFTHQEIADRLHIASKATLASSDGETLAAIFVFAGEHPLYNDSPSQIFCKSNLHLLHTQSPIDSENEYPVFHSNELGSRAAFEFTGWVRIVDVQYHAPESDGLREMLGIKWKNKRGRTEEAWKESFGKTWAVVTLRKVEGRKDNPMHEPSN